MHAFFAESFQPMNAAVTFQIGWRFEGNLHLQVHGKFSGNPDDLYESPISSDKKVMAKVKVFQK